MEEPERVYGWQRFGTLTRCAIIALAVVAVIFLVLGSVSGQAWPFLVAAPCALLVLMFVGSAFAGPDIDE